MSGMRADKQRVVHGAKGWAGAEWGEGEITMLRPTMPQRTGRR